MAVLALCCESSTADCAGKLTVCFKVTTGRTGDSSGASQVRGGSKTPGPQTSLAWSKSAAEAAAAEPRPSPWNAGRLGQGKRFVPRSCLRGTPPCDGLPTPAFPRRLQSQCSSTARKLQLSLPAGVLQKRSFAKLRAMQAQVNHQNARSGALLNEAPQEPPRCVHADLLVLL